MEKEGWYVVAPFDRRVADRFVGHVSASAQSGAPAHFDELFVIENQMVGAWLGYGLLALMGPPALVRSALLPTAVPTMSAEPSGSTLAMEALLPGRVDPQIVKAELLAIAESSKEHRRAARTRAALAARVRLAEAEERKALEAAAAAAREAQKHRSYISRSQAELFDLRRATERAEAAVAARVSGPLLPAPPSIVVKPPPRQRRRIGRLLLRLVRPSPRVHTSAAMETAPAAPSHEQLGAPECASRLALGGATHAHPAAFGHPHVSKSLITVTAAARRAESTRAGQEMAVAERSAGELERVAGKMRGLARRARAVADGSRAELERNEGARCVSMMPALIHARAASP